jgi:hypothetical protein
MNFSSRSASFPQCAGSSVREEADACLPELSFPQTGRMLPSPLSYIQPI